MKKLLLLSLMASFGVINFASAQAKAAQAAPKMNQQATTGGPSIEKNAQKMTDIMIKDLGLNSSIQSKLYDINYKYAKLNSELRGSNKTGDDLKKQKQEYSKQKDAELKGIMSADEFKNYQAKRQDIITQMREKD